MDECKPLNGGGDGEPSRPPQLPPRRDDLARQEEPEEKPLIDLDYEDVTTAANPATAPSSARMTEQTPAMHALQQEPPNPPVNEPATSTSAEVQPAVLDINDISNEVVEDSTPEPAAAAAAAAVAARPPAPGHAAASVSDPPAEMWNVEGATAGAVSKVRQCRLNQ